MESRSTEKCCEPGMGDGTEIPRDLRPGTAVPGLIFLNLRGTGTHFRGTVPRGNGTGTENPASAGQQNPAGLGTVPHIFAVPRHSIVPQKIQRAFDLHLFLASKIAVTCFLMPMNF